MTAPTLHTDEELCELVLRIHGCPTLAEVDAMITYVAPRVGPNHQLTTALLEFRTRLTAADRIVEMDVEDDGSWTATL